MPIVKPPLQRPGSRFRRRSEPARELAMSPPPGDQLPMRTFQRSPARSPQHTADDALEPHANVVACAKPRALFRLTGNRRWPHRGPTEHARYGAHKQPENRIIGQMHEFSGFRRVGDPGLEPGTSSLSGMIFAASSRPNSNLIPANACNSTIGSRMETTGRYNLVAPSWPHDRNSRAGCRVARKRSSCRRYGQSRMLGRRA